MNHPIPADPAALWDVSKRILFAVAWKVKQAIRLKLVGHGRGEAEAEELVHDAFICIVEALPRFNPATAKLTTFVYGLARRRMWLVARAAFYGLSPEQMHAWTRPKEHHAIMAANLLLALRQRGRKTPGRGNRCARSLPSSSACR